MNLRLIQRLPTNNCCFFRFSRFQIYMTDFKPFNAYSVVITIPQVDSLFLIKFNKKITANTVNIQMVNINIIPICIYKFNLTPIVYDDKLAECLILDIFIRSFFKILGKSIPGLSRYYFFKKFL